MVQKILVNHLFRHLAGCYTKIASCLKMLPPIPFLNMGKLLEYFSRGTPLHPLHDVRRRDIRWGRNQDMHMVLARHSSQYLNLKPFTGLTNKFPQPKCKISLQQLVAVLGYPNKMILDLVLCMATLAIFHIQNYRPTAS